MGSIPLYDGSASVWASIHANGDLRISSEDGETECVAAVPAERKGELLDLLRSELGPLAGTPEAPPDGLLLECVRIKWSGRSNAVREFHEVAGAKGLKPTWFRWP